MELVSRSCPLGDNMRCNGMNNWRRSFWVLIWNKVFNFFKAQISPEVHLACIPHSMVRYIS